jgi:hypothetical protein
MSSTKAHWLAASLLYGACSSNPGHVASALSAPPGEINQDLESCRLFPADNPWNQDISAARVDPHSERYLRAMNAGHKTIHPDFGSNPKHGIPWIAVSGTQPRVPMRFTWPDESDPGPYPFPPSAPVERGAGDRHVIVVDRHACRLYEGHNCRRDGPGWRCDAGAVFDLLSNRRRPEGWTSADAAGLPILPGLVRRDEVLAGEIRHALRFTVARTQRAYVAPATHFSSDHRDPALPPMGLRVRLKSSYDTSALTGAPRVILEALKKYGMFLADNGSDWYLSGETNPDWDDDELEPLRKVPASAFEVVEVGPVQR